MYSKQYVSHNMYSKQYVSHNMYSKQYVSHLKSLHVFLIILIIWN